MLDSHNAPRRIFLASQATGPPILRYSLPAVILLLIYLPSVIDPVRSQEIDPEDVVRVRTDLVTIPVLVNDSKGRRVPGLAPSDFLVRDDGQEMEVKFFSTGTE